MRALLVLVAVTGCSPASPEVPVDATQLDVGRTVRSVLVGDDTIIWVHGEGPLCHHDFGCPTSGPSVTVHDRASEMTYPLVEDGIGMRAIAGTDREFFVVTGPVEDEMNVVRMDGDGNAVNMSIPRTWTMGATLDDTYVYWADRPDYAHPFSLHRALRNGRGDNAATLADIDDALPDLTYAAGYIWWSGVRGLARIPVSGGSIETLSISTTALTVYGDELYVGTTSPNGDGGWTAQVGVMLPDGSFQMIAEQVTRGDYVRYLVRDGDRLFWSLDDGNLYSSAVTGGPIRTIDARDRAGYVFAVLPDKILVEFTRTGFRSISR